MSKIILYIAQSLDGYIADENGSFDFLNDYMRPEQDYGYSEFLKNLSAVIMGSTTYKDILKMNYWYDGLETYVFSSKPITIPEGKTAYQINGDPTVLADKLRLNEKDSWLMGGGKLITWFMNAKLIDEIIISIIPKTLGKGIPVFERIDKTYKLQLKESKSFEDGVVQLHYIF